MIVPFHDEEEGIVMGSPVQTLGSYGLADCQHNKLRNLPMVDNISRQIPRKLGESQNKDECYGTHPIASI